MAREKRMEVKEKLLEPINLEVEEELSAYELLRENNIKEIQDAMKDSGWFSD